MNSVMDQALKLMKQGGNAVGGAFTRPEGAWGPLDPGSLLGSYKNMPANEASQKMAMEMGMMYGGAKPLNPVARGISPMIQNIHPEDQKELINIIAKLQSKTKINPQEGTDLQRLTDHYLGKNFSTETNSRIAKAFDHFLAKQGGGIPGKY